MSNVLVALGSEPDEPDNVVKAFYQVDAEIPEQDPVLRTAAYRIRALHAKIEGDERDKLEAGKLLSEVHDKVVARGRKGEGFKKWITDNCGFTPPTGYHYMHLFEHSQKHPEILNLSLMDGYIKAGIIPAPKEKLRGKAA